MHNLCVRFFVYRPLCGLSDGDFCKCGDAREARHGRWSSRRGKNHPSTTKSFHGAEAHRFLSPRAPQPRLLPTPCFPGFFLFFFSYNFSIQFKDINYKIFCKEKCFFFYYYYYFSIRL
jgi:hypothetical protein